MSFTETGKYQHLITATIEKNEKLSELKKPEGKWMTPEEVVDAIDIKHLDQKYHKEIKDMFMKYHTTLSKNDMDIPEAKNYFADPIIKPQYLNKPLAVKYKAINWNIKDDKTQNFCYKYHWNDNWLSYIQAFVLH